MKPSSEQFLASVKSIERFSPAPVILAGALKVLRDPEADVDAIAVLVGRDTALAADILRCSNSAYYGGKRNSSISEAVCRIGTRETVRLLNLAVARIVGNRDLACYGITGPDFWAESLFNGLFLQALAKETGVADAEEAYTAGLLRYIGRLAIDQAAGSLHCGLYWDGEGPIADWERENVGVTQARAGGILLRTWRFSEPIVRAIEAQDTTAPGRDDWFTGALHFAAALLPEGVGVPFSPEVGATWSMTPAGAAFMHAHGLDPASVDTLLHATSENFDAIRRNFEN
jgi:HD-like signal output (HDOD) protein